MMKKIRMTIDIAMTLVLIGLMAYSLIGELTHEILGTAMILLFVVHHILNRRWFGALLKGRYRTFRIFQTVLVFLMLVSVLASAISGIVLSQHLYRFLNISKGASIARSVHMVCAYLNYILMSLHLGLHWNVMLSAMSQDKVRKSAAGMWILRVIAIGISAYGAYAFIKRQIGEYLFLRTHFVFLDPAEPIIFFFVDYAAILVLFVFLGHYLGKVLKSKKTAKYLHLL